MLRLENEDQLLDINFRKKIIEEIKGPENLMRKDEAYKRYQCYKDQTKTFVYGKLLNQFDKDTVEEMSYAMSNLAFVRKTTDKLARVYKYGVEREALGDERTTEAIHAATKECDVNSAFKKTNRFLKLNKNCVQYIIPKSVNLDSERKTIKPLVLPPYLYDAIELTDNREKAGAYILSDYDYRRIDPAIRSTVGLAAQSGVDPRDGQVFRVKSYSDGIDQKIADDPRDTNRFQGFIFWSNKYHFTCNDKGEIISEGEITNPIDVMPFVNYAEDQDGSFWSIGGDDLVDGAILVNSMITNINHIAITQGYGQIVMTGKSLPRNLKVGPNKAILLEQNEGDPTPTFKFETASPPLDQLRSLVEMYVALYLTTNNLSTSGVSMTLNGGAGFPSGVAMMLDKAESMEDIEDQRQVFIDNEPIFWDIFSRWHKILKSEGSIVEELRNIEFANSFDLNIKFGEPKVLLSEKEQLEVVEQKLKLKLISRVDAMRLEWPDLTDDQIMEKLEEVINEGIKYGINSQRDIERDRDSERERDDESPDSRLPPRADSDRRSEQEEPSIG